MLDPTASFAVNAPQLIGEENALISAVEIARLALAVIIHRSTAFAAATADCFF